MTKTLSVILFLFASIELAQAEQPAISLRIQEEWSNVFGGKEAIFHASVTSSKSFQGRSGWRFSSAGRTIARGENEIAVEPHTPQVMEINFRVPEVREGVIMQASLSVSVFKGGAGNAVTNLQKRIWIFPEDPFADRKEWLKDLQIHLFDPEKKTAELFRDAEIPFQEIRNIDAFNSITNGSLIIGEGVSFRDYRGLSEMMIRTSASGIPVLCLAPVEGDLTLPGMGDVNLPQPQRIVFKRNNVIKELDKRLDDRAWPPDGKIAVSSLKLKGERGPVVGEVMSRSTGSGQEGGDNWTWLEMDFGDNEGKPVRQAQGRLVICGFGIIEKWDSGPTPRFLLAKVLEYMNSHKEAQKAQEGGRHE